MKKIEGKFSSFGKETGTEMTRQAFETTRSVSRFRGRGRGRGRGSGRGRGGGRGREKRWYHFIRKDDVKELNKFENVRGMPRGKGHFVYPDTFLESTNEEDKHVTVFHQIVNQKKKRDNLSKKERISRRNQLQKIQQNALKLFNIEEKFGLPNENHLLPLEEYKGWNIENMLCLLSKVRALVKEKTYWKKKKKVDEMWSKKGLETPASWVFDELLKNLEPPALKDSLDYAKVFLAKQCQKDITETIRSEPKKFPGMFLLEIEVLQAEASRVLREKINLNYEDFLSVVSSVVRYILLQLSSEKVKKTWVTIADSFKENPELYPMQNTII